MAFSTFLSGICEQYKLPMEYINLSNPLFQCLTTKDKKSLKKEIRKLVKTDKESKKHRFNPSACSVEIRRLIEKQIFTGLKGKKIP